jgi:hypothetical protein
MNPTIIKDDILYPQVAGDFVLNYMHFFAASNKYRLEDSDPPVSYLPLVCMVSDDLCHGEMSSASGWHGQTYPISHGSSCPLIFPSV